jgi:hypothetical protein
MPIRARGRADDLRRHHRGRDHLDLIAPFVGRMLRFFPPVVTGTIILVIGVSLMRIGINWIFGNPVGPTAPKLVDPAHAEWLKAVTDGAPPAPSRPARTAAQVRRRRDAETRPMRRRQHRHLGHRAGGDPADRALCPRLCRQYRGADGHRDRRHRRGGLGKMTFDKVAEAAWFGMITPFHFGMPIFDR